MLYTFLHNPLLVPFLFTTLLPFRTDTMVVPCQPGNWDS